MFREHLASMLRKAGIKHPSNGEFFDGCTCAPDFIFKDCCDVHDYRYWLARNPDFASPMLRLKADRALRDCMRQAVRESDSVIERILLWPMPYIYYAAVRLFGKSYWG